MLLNLDSRLIHSAQQGDPVALEILLEKCRPGLRRYAERYCLTGADVEDAVQESLLIICRYLPTLRSVIAFTGWLLQIARRECYRIARRVLPQNVPIDQTIEQQYVTTRTDVELRLDVIMAIQSLPDIYREVIVLRDFEELTVKEIANRLSATPETIKTRIHRGRQMIREHLLA